MAAVDRALALYRDRERWRALQANGMSADFSWGASARQYVEVYRRALGLAGRSTPDAGREPVAGVTTDAPARSVAVPAAGGPADSRTTEVAAGTAPGPSGRRPARRTAGAPSGTPKPKGRATPPGKGKGTGTGESAGRVKPAATKAPSKAKAATRAKAGSEAGTRPSRKGAGTAPKPKGRRRDG